VTTEAKYLAIDPGDTFGFAKFDSDGNMCSLGQEHEDNFIKWSDENITSDLDTVIVEDYKLIPGKKSRGQAWSRMKTSKQIGKIELMCEMRGVKLVLQPNNKYPIGAMWGGFTIPSNHAISHQYVAAAHGVFYLQQQGIRKPGQGLK
jgi:hypothetical protein